MLRILLADDLPQVRSALRLLLEMQPEWGVVGEATEAENLLIQAQTTQPDLVLLDWELPGLSALELLPILRRYCPHVIIIALSGKLEARQAALAAGTDAFVSKGDPPEELLTILVEIGDMSRNRGEVQIMKRTLVEEWMVRDVVTITPDVTLSEAHNLILQKQVQRLPVVQANKLVGIVTFGDIWGTIPAQSTASQPREDPYSLSKSTTVAKIMIPDPVTVSQKATVGEAAWLMLQHKVGGLPVIDPQGDLCGIITRSDIFRRLVREWRKAETLKLVRE